MLATAALAGCVQPCPRFEPSLPSDLVLASTTDAQAAAFCMEQATYVWNYTDHALYHRGQCLVAALDDPTITDVAACERSVTACVAGPDVIPYAYDCGLPRVPACGAGPESACGETVGQRAACVSEQVCGLWPTLGAHLDCSMLGDHEAIRRVYELPGADAPHCVMAQGI